MQSLLANVLTQYESLRKAVEGKTNIETENDEAHQLYLELKELRKELADTETRFQSLQVRKTLGFYLGRLK